MRFVTLLLSLLAVYTVPVSAIDRDNLNAAERALFDYIMANRDISRCACSLSDPHIKTFDGVRTDCQGSGDYILAKSLTSDYQLQARFSIEALTQSFNPFTGRRETFDGTVTKSTVVTTGVAGEPKVETFAGSNKAENIAQCEMEWFFNDVEKQYIGAGNGGSGDGTDYSGHGFEDLGWGIFLRSGTSRILFFKQSRIWMEYHKWFFPKWGCAMNVCTCLPQNIRSQGVVGIFGSPNFNWRDDYMKKDGSTIHWNSRPRSIAAQNQYCLENWCIDKKEDNNFKYPLNGCKADLTRDLDDAIEGVDEQVKEMCLWERDCILDTIVSGDSSVGLRTLEEEQNIDKHEVDPTRHEEDNVEGDQLCGLPAERFQGNKFCKDFGYDYGYKMAGCDPADDGNFNNANMELTQLKAEATCDGTQNPGSFELQCSVPDGNQFRNATITPSVNTVVKMKGGNGGVLYKNLQAGQTYTVNVGDAKAISHMEFCFKCEDLPPTDSPTDSPTPSPTDSPTDSPTPSPTDSPTDSPTSSPTSSPTNGPTAGPTSSPTGGPTAGPTSSPTAGPTAGPTSTPTAGPTAGPTSSPTPSPTDSPTSTPTEAPTDPPAPDSPTLDRSGQPDVYVKGDPHFKTFGGEMYDFHGECDLVLLHNPQFKNGLGMDIHVRTKIEDFWSSVETAAIMIGEDTLEIQANPGSTEWLWINGNPVTGMEQGKWQVATISGFLVRYKESSPSVREAHVYLKEGASKEKIFFKTFKSFVHVDLDMLDTINFVGSSGLLGSYDHNGARLGRDGKTLIKNTHKFGQEWQVLDSEPRLFHSYEGAVVGQKCIMPPTWTAEAAAKMEKRKRRLGESAMTESDAEKLCDHLHDPEEIKACVFDVLATQDASMASAW